ncbi:MAG: efflux transporter periplasmic adaptor subunit [Betaproteobacteria bacterium RIFCSPLOWO2_02_FULL_65_24]|nr:MAG: efflux transporter periplasmic adaptor subunit [Betaproteobacteria bacterium RIFCSPLOWO2_02_FULL_65_24]
MQTQAIAFTQKFSGLLDASRPHRLGLALSCVSLVVLISGCGQGRPDAAHAAIPAAPALPAVVLQVAPQRVPIAVEAVGQIEGSKEVEVRARVSGIVLKRLYHEGDLVRAGAPMFKIDPAPFEIALAQAQAQLAQEQARNEQSRRESVRLKQLAAEKAISQKEYDDASSNLKLSHATLQAAAAKLREAELNLSYTSVAAPVSGVSGRAVRSEGSLITAGADSLLTSISQVDPIWVRFSLSESDLAKLPQRRLVRGAQVEIGLVMPDGTRYPGKGRLNFAATQIDTRLGTQQLRAEFDNAKGQLLPGQFVRVQLVAGQRDNVFLVPQTAVMAAEAGYMLFVMDKEGKAALRPVQLGDWIGSDWMVLGGLAAGDRVIVDNLLKLRPGAAVSPLAPGQGKPAKAGPAPANTSVAK